jgi:hypothetical protein
MVEDEVVMKINKRMKRPQDQSSPVQIDAFDEGLEGQLIPM